MSFGTTKDKMLVIQECANSKAVTIFLMVDPGQNVESTLPAILITNYRPTHYDLYRAEYWYYCLYYCLLVGRINQTYTLT
jgi:hypothetical protein